MGMVTTVELDQETAEALLAQARAQGLSLGSYLRSLAEAWAAAPSNGNVSAEDFDRRLDELAAGLPGLAPLPADFSRADLYADHD